MWREHGVRDGFIISSPQRNQGKRKARAKKRQPFGDLDVTTQSPVCSGDTEIDNL
jgi:hypothetical protein